MPTPEIIFDLFLAFASDNMKTNDCNSISEMTMLPIPPFDHIVGIAAYVATL